MIYPFQRKDAMLEEKQVMAVKLPGNRIGFRFPGKKMGFAIWRYIKLCGESIQKMAETHKGDHMILIFLHRRPLRRSLVQNKVDIPGIRG